MWPSVSVPVLSVNSTSMSPRSSMHTSRLTSTFFAASRRDPVARLVETTAGSSWGVMPTATARENSTASMTGRPRATLITKIVTLSTPPTLANSPEKRVRPSWNSVWGWCSPEPDGDPPELGRGAGGHHDGVGGALVHDRPHEQARRQLRERSAARHRVGRTSPPAPTRRSGSTRRTRGCSRSAAARRRGRSNRRRGARCRRAPGG